MKKAQILGIVIAGAAGIAAFAMMRGLVNRAPETLTKEVTVNATRVLVARNNINLGDIVTADNFDWQTWPSDGLSSAYITSDRPGVIDELAGSVARMPLIAGEPVTAQKLIKAGDGGVLAAILPPGMRAVSTRIEQKTAVGGLILPNDHVDVILIRHVRGRSGADEYASDTLFRNIRVLAIGQQLEPAPGQKAAEASSNTTATLELTPRQAELLALADQMGEITLALRSIADINSEGQNLTGEALDRDQSNSVQVLRYGIKSRAYGVN